MRRFGFTAAGTQRWECVLCRTTGVKKRRDNVSRLWSSRFVPWLTGSERLFMLRRRWKVSYETVRRHFEPLWMRPPLPHHVELTTASVLILDATALVSRHLVVLVARTPKGVVAWRFGERESYVEWGKLLDSLHGKPCAVVCDGQKGLEKAVFERWPDIFLQRCTAHVERQALVWLTRKPKTDAGRELRSLVLLLSNVRDRRKADAWIHAFESWCDRRSEFLAEHTPHPFNPRRWWYTHRKLRAVRSLLKNSAPFLFTWILVPGVPRTTNHVEGGINSRLKDLFRIHRGISPQKKIALTAWYLYHRQSERKSTRNGY